MKKNSELKRELGFFPLTNIVVANMIGAGIFTTSGLILKELHDPVLMLILWGAGGIIALCGALTYGELSAAIPQAGGEYVFLSKLIHPAAGFLSGWVSLFVGFSAPIAASALAFFEYFSRGLPGIFGRQIVEGPSGSLITQKLFAIFIIAVFTFIHSRGIKVGAMVQNLLTILKIGIIVGLIFVGFSFGDGSFDHFTQGAGSVSNSNEWKSVGLCLLWIMFAYSGWNASSYLGGEVKKPKRNIPLSLIVGTCIVIAIYLLINTLFIYATPNSKMEGVISIGGLIANDLLGKSFEQIVSVLIGVALFSSLSAYILLGPRIYYAMAKDMFFFKFASQVHPKYGVPSKSILMQGTLAVIMILFGTFEQILTYMGFSLGIFPLLSVIGLFKLRRKGMSSIKLPGFPIAPLIFLASGIFMLAMSFMERPFESGIAILTVLVGVPFYFYFLKSKNIRSRNLVKDKIAATTIPEPVCIESE